MKLYDSDWAPNPRRVRIFLAEKGIDIERVTVDLAAGAHFDDSFKKINPLQRVPVLELDDGTMIAELVAICRYFEEMHPVPPLFGRDPKEKALVEMWNRRVELNFYNSVAAAFRHLHPRMARGEVPQVAAWGEANKPKALAYLKLFDAALADGRPFIAGEHYSIADITFLVAFDFMKVARLSCPPDLVHVLAWHDRVSARPSAAAR